MSGSVSADQLPESLFRRLQETEQRFTDIEQQMNDPEVASNGVRLVELSRERGTLLKIVEPYREYLDLIRQIADSRELADDSSQDAELRELAREEIDEHEARIDELLEQMKRALVTSADESVSSIIMEIRAGTGGDEAALFAGDLVSMYQRFAERCNYSFEIMEGSAGEMGGYKEAVLNVKGPGVLLTLGYEGGGHRVQRVPETESQGRIHTSAATVAVLPEAEEVDIQINPDDVVEHVSRAGGPGGQNVNKVSSAIKLEHLPTGITVSMRDEKSQHKNRAKAWRILRSRIYEQVATEQRAERDATRKSMIGSGDRSQRIRTYNYPQNRVTDHRVHIDLYSLDQIMMGNLDELVEALQKYDMDQRLKNL